jgi:hypothetical protein
MRTSPDVVKDYTPVKSSLPETQTLVETLIFDGFFGVTRKAVLKCVGNNIWKTPNGSIISPPTHWKPLNK